SRTAGPPTGTIAPPSSGPPRRSGRRPGTPAGTSGTSGRGRAPEKRARSSAQAGVSAVPPPVGSASRGARASPARGAAGERAGPGGEGCAGEAIDALLDWAFVHRAVRAVRALAGGSPTPASRVLERCGFTAAGKEPAAGPLEYAIQREEHRAARLKRQFPQQ